MKKSTFYIFGLLLFFSCNLNRETKSIDKLVNSKVLETINANDKELWAKIEKTVLNQMNAVELFVTNDTLKSFQNLNASFLAMGINKDFYLNREIVQNRNLINELEIIGLNENDNCAQRFLFQICKPLIEEFETVNGQILEPTNVFKTYAATNPDKTSMSFELAILEFNSHPERLAKLWNKSGSRKIIFLIYLSEIIKSK